MHEKVTEIFNLAQDTRNMQIKGDKQLEDLKSSVEVMSDKFDKYEKDRKEKEKSEMDYRMRSAPGRKGLIFLKKNLTIVSSIPAENVY